MSTKAQTKTVAAKKNVAKNNKVNKATKAKAPVAKVTKTKKNVVKVVKKPAPVAKHRGRPFGSNSFVMVSIDQIAKLGREHIPVSKRFLKGLGMDTNCYKDVYSPELVEKPKGERDTIKVTVEA